MADESKAHYSEGRYSYATIYAKDILGVKLGDLRKLVAAAYEVEDEATVYLEEVSSSTHYQNRYHARRVTVEHQKKEVEE